MAKFHYEKIDGLLPETTLFIHGNLASNRWWYPAEQIWRGQAKNKNLSGAMILAEFWGCGQTPAPKSVSDVDMRRMADEFIAVVSELNVGPVNLVGHSTGGLIACLMLAKAPHLFKKAVLLDPVGAQGVKFDDSMTAAFEAMRADKNLTSQVMASTIYNNDANADFFKQIVVEDAYHAVQTVGVWVLQNLDGLDIRAELAKVSHPTLVLHGEHDVLLPLQDSKALASLLKNGQFKVIEGQGHCTNAENPGKFVSLVSEFLFA